MEAEAAEEAEAEVGLRGAPEVSEGRGRPSETRTEGRRVALCWRRSHERKGPGEQ